MNAPLKIRGRGGIMGGGDDPPRDAPDSLTSTAFVRVCELLSEGPIVGLTHGAQSIFFGGTPLQNVDETYNFEDVTWEFKGGDPDQTYMPGFSGVESEAGISTEVSVAIGPVVRSTGLPDIDAVRVTIRFGRLVRAVESDSGSSLGTTRVDYAIEYRHHEDLEWVPFDGSPFTVNGKNSSGFEKQHYQRVRADDEAREGPWQIRVTRITPDATDPTKVVDVFAWQGLTDIIESKFIRPDTAYIGLQVPAKTFGGGVPVRSYDIMGRVIRVPSNYDFQTREYTGVWNGSFQLAWTDNPAWILLDLLTNTRYGLGLTDERVDIAGLYTIARYCDEMVSDGQGGTQARYTLNAVINNQQSAYDLINKIVSNFMGMVYYSAGGLMVTQDSPREIDTIVAPANVADGDFTYSDQSHAETSNMVLVTWDNPVTQKGDVELVQDTEDVILHGPKLRKHTLFGVRKQSRAQRMGRWSLYTGFFNGESVVYRAGLDHADVMPGWVVGIRDPERDRKRIGGRLLSAAANVVQLDSSVTLASGVTYTVMLMHPDKTVHTYDVLSGAGATSSVELSAAVPFGMEGALWALLEGAPPLSYRVISRSAVDKVTYEIAAIRYRADKFDLIESDQDIELDMYEPPAVTPIARPAAVTVQEYLVRLPGGTVAPAVLIGWSAALDARVVHYLIQVKSGEGPWTDAGKTTGLSIAVENTPPGTTQVRVRSETNIGRQSEWAEVTTTLFGLALTPPDVTGFVISPIGDRATLNWDPSTALNVRGYEIRYSPLLSGAIWSSSVMLTAEVPGTTVDVPSLVGTYMIKAVTYGETYSLNAAEITSTISGEIVRNVIEVFSEQPDWLGTKTDTEVNDAEDALQLAGAGTIANWLALSDVTAMSLGNGFVSEGSYQWSDPFDLGEVFTSRVVPSLAAVGNNILDVIGAWESLADTASMSRVSEEEWGVEMEFRFTDDDPLGTPVWSDWTPARVGDYTFRAMDMRILLSTTVPSLTPMVTIANVSVDMPDRIISDTGDSIPSGGLTVVFDPPYKAFKGVGIVVNGLPSGGRYALTGAGVSGFTIQSFNSGGTGIAGTTLHYVSTGYGRGA